MEANEGQPRTARPQEQRLEPTALAAFLTALVLGWCPLTALAAVVLAIVALRRIRRDQRRTGQPLAMAALGIATVALLVDGWLIGQLQSRVQESMTAQAIEAVEGSLTPVPAVEPEWDARPGATVPSADERAEFARLVAQQAGAVRQVSITRQGAEGLTDPVVSTAFNATCERATVFGNATFATVQGSLPPHLQLRSIEVEVGGKRLALPAGKKP